MLERGAHGDGRALADRPPVPRARAASPAPAALRPRRVLPRAKTVNARLSETVSVITVVRRISDQVSSGAILGCWSGCRFGGNSKIQAIQVCSDWMVSITYLFKLQEDITLSTQICSR